MSAMRWFYRRLRTDQLSGGARFNHFRLPSGTVLTFMSRKGNVFKIRLLDSVFEGHSRNVEVVQAPVEYNPAAAPTIMCVVPPRTRVGIMGNAYEAAISTVGPRDVVYLLDRFDRGSVPPFEVHSVVAE
jgi:hypothetical protein